MKNLCLVFLFGFIIFSSSKIHQTLHANPLSKNTEINLFLVSMNDKEVENAKNHNDGKLQDYDEKKMAKFQKKIDKVKKRIDLKIKNTLGFYTKINKEREKLEDEHKNYIKITEKLHKDLLKCIKKEEHLLNKKTNTCDSCLSCDKLKENYKNIEADYHNVQQEIVAILKKTANIY